MATLANARGILATVSVDLEGMERLLSPEYGRAEPEQQQTALRSYLQSAKSAVEELGWLLDDLADGESPKGPPDS
jgi:hypothetical protein